MEQPCLQAVSRPGQLFHGGEAFHSRQEDSQYLIKIGTEGTEEGKEKDLRHALRIGAWGVGPMWLCTLHRRLVYHP